MKEYRKFDRIGTKPHRSYYIPFAADDEISYKHKIIDRNSSSRFLPLCGTWQIKSLRCPEDFSLSDDLCDTIPVPSCVQIHGYDGIQYLNARYPFPVMPPYVPRDNPSWHYRRTFDLRKSENEKYYLNFEGVDSAFYLYVNGKYKGYSQISHATSEFDITEFVVNGENTVDVLVLKWCVSTYLECQDKYRFSGIFRDVYILRRPPEHITDYKIETTFSGNDGIITFKNESLTDITLTLGNTTVIAGAGSECRITVNDAKPWSPESPELYTLELSSNGEKILERIGFRNVTIDGFVFKVNDMAVKLLGVNRHDFNCDTGATVTLQNMYDDIVLMKELCVNAVRTSHYPNSPEFYLLCDAHGIYVMDEADLEMHGACVRHGGYDRELWSQFAEDEMFSPGITDRYKALVERDKNRTSVILWSLGNESSFGKAYFEGAEYIKSRDKTRPVHYEGLQWADPKYYRTELVDVVSMMYPSPQTIRESVLDDPEETRPFVLCEYTHAMGNSCGDIGMYVDMIRENEQMMGAFVWEWVDHGIRTKKGFLYGGDFGESEHDGNFCIDGLLTPDRKIKTSALEMKAAYSGKKKPDIRDISIPYNTGRYKEVSFTANEFTGEITSVKADGREILKTPIRLNVARYIDNDRSYLHLWESRYHLDKAKTHVISFENDGNTCHFKSVVSANCMAPAIEFEMDISAEANTLTIGLEYTVADYVESVPRFGIEFGIDKSYSDFSYIGFGPTESYSDKHLACEYGMYCSNARDNYCMDYIRPQESGSHYASKYLCVDKCFSLTADVPFSFSVNPYTTKQLCTTPHNFELEENDFVNVCVDVAMRGIGSSSCGPGLSEEYALPKKGKNTFRFVF